MLEKTEKTLGSEQHLVTGRSNGSFPMKILEMLASVKLTVYILILAVFMIWVASLQQVEHDIWKIKKMHFPAPVVSIPLYTFFPAVWFPETREYLQNQPPLFDFTSESEEAAKAFADSNSPKAAISILLPSGFSIIVAMLINLIAAHSLRFRIQGKGGWLIAGTGLLAFGTVLSYLVVRYGSLNPSNMESAKGIINPLWYAIVAGLGFAGFALFFTGFRWLKTSFNFSILQFFAGGVLTSTSAFLIVTPEAQLNASGMRILWQICQCSVACLVMLGGLQFIFKRKAGMVLLHAGMILLLANEIWVTVAHKEQKVDAAVGDTVTYAEDIRAVDLAIIDRSGKDEDKIVMIPAEKLIRNLNASRSSKSEPVYMDIPSTGLEMEVLEYYPNSTFTTESHTDKYKDRRSTHGIGAQLVPVPKAPVNALSNDANYASALIKVTNKESGVALGTYWATQLRLRFPGPMFQTPNVVKDGDKQLVMALWFRREYKDYDLNILDIEAKYYPGTKTPQKYSTEFVLTNHRNDYQSNQKVWMNNPLRYQDETFYQANYYVSGGVVRTGLQVVWNRGWMIPYLCCAMVGIGMLAHFIPNMLKYVEKASTIRIATNTSKKGWMIPVFITVGCVLLIMGRERPKTPKWDDLKLTGLGQLPSSFQGRVQPIDSLIRNALRQTTGYESAESTETTFTGSHVKHPGLLFLSKICLDDKDGDRYRCLKVDNRELLGKMQLPLRSGFRYSLADVYEYNGGNRKKTDSLLKDFFKAQKTDAETQTSYQKALITFQTHYHTLRGIKHSVRPLPDSESLIDRMFAAADKSLRKTSPGVIPGETLEHPWLPLSEAQIKMELQEQAKDYQVSDIYHLLGPMIDRDLAKALVKAEYEKELEDAANAANPEEAKKSVLKADDPKRFSKLVEKLKTQSWAQRAVLVRNVLENPVFGGNKNYTEIRFNTLRRIYNVESVGSPVAPHLLTEKQIAITKGWGRVWDAVADKNQENLDQSVAEVNVLLADHYPDMVKQLPRVKAEYQFNQWQLTYISQILYLMAGILAAVSGFFLTDYLRRSGYSLLWVAVAVHTLSMLARLYISEKAPITSIYTSAFAIAWGLGLTFALIETFTKKTTATVLGGLAGFATLLIAYGLSTKGDTFVVLQAVLDTKFWLWTHVIIIAIGYLLTFVAGLWGISIACKAILGKINRNEVRDGMNIAYGVLCAATLASFIGTVLGGLWADDSWGRFWGWDTKENGAAMIVLWNAAILHARWSGMIRFRGLIFMMSLGNMVTAWSWFAVNELGIGLHSYGFTEGVIYWLALFWVSQFVLGLIAFIPCESLSRNSNNNPSPSLKAAGGNG